jgi:lytic cellulose monooxygenase (C1-hydroxylating)
MSLYQVMTYIAKCPNGCANFKGDSGNVWVKIEQSGWDKTKVSLPDKVFQAYSLPYTTFQTPAWGSDQLAANGAKWTTKVPAGLANGEYILRLVY